MYVILNDDFEYVHTIMSYIPVPKMCTIMKNMHTQIQHPKFLQKLTKSIQKSGYNILEQAMISSQNIHIVSGSGQLLD